MKSKIWILIVLLLGGAIGGCIDEKTTDKQVALSDRMGYMGPDYIFNGNLYEVETAVSGIFLVGDSDVSVLILNTDSPENATVSMLLLEKSEKLRSVSKEALAINVNGHPYIGVLVFENNSEYSYIWKEGNVVFRLESKNKQALNRIFDLCKTPIVHEDGVYLERFDISGGGNEFQIYGNYKAEYGEASFDVNVFQDKSDAEKAFEDGKDAVNRMYSLKLRLNQTELEEVRRACINGSSCLPESIQEQTEDTMIYTTLKSTEAILLKGNLFIELRFSRMTNEETSIIKQFAVS